VLLECAWVYYFLVTQQLLVGQNHFSFEASRSHTHHITVCRLLWTSDQPDADSCTWQHTTITTDNNPCPWLFRTSNPNKRAVADSCVRTRGYRDPLKCVYLLQYAYPLLLSSFVFVVIYFKLQKWRKGIWLSLKHRNLSTGLYQKLRDAPKSARAKFTLIYGAASVFVLNGKI